jgi:hypothetical protein
MGSATDLHRAPTNPVVDLVGYGGEIAHGPLPHVSASRSAPIENARPVDRVSDKGKNVRPNENSARAVLKLKGRDLGEPSVEGIEIIFVKKGSAGEKCVRATEVPAGTRRD